MTERKAGPGRPPKHDKPMLECFTLRLPPAMAKRIHEIANKRMDAPDKAQVIRELLAFALEHETA